MLDIALEYLGRGWSVVPAQPKGKKPMVEWAKFTEQKPTAEQVRHWWAQWPTANIAVITGKISGIVAVDIDTNRGGNPHKVFEDHPTGLISRTGSGGYHLLYTYPQGVDNVANRVGKDGIDIRGDGGYIIAPPSIHVSGKAYEFIANKAMEEAPDWACHPVEITEERDSNAKWLSELLQGISSGGRNDGCARLAGYYADKGIVKDAALIMLQQWNERNDPPLSISEIETTVKSVYKTAYRKQAAEGKKPGNPKQPSKPTNFSLVGFNAYMEKYGDAAVKWNIEEWLPCNTIAFVISPPGSYKTWTVLDLVVSIASGKPFLGHFPVAEPGPVLVIQQEDYHGQIADRLGVIIAAKYGLSHEFDPKTDDFVSPNPPELPIYIHPDRMLKLDNPGIISALEEQIARIRPKLVILDPLYSAGSTEDYMAKTAEQMFVFKQMRDKYDCSFLVVHHTKKSTEGSSVREGAWGSQFLNAFLETGWQIRRIPEETTAISLQRHFKVKGATHDLRVSFDIVTEFPYRYSVEVSEIDIEEENKKTDIIGIIEKEGPLNPTEIAAKVGTHRSTIARKIAPLVKAKALVKLKDGKYGLPEGLPSI